MKSWRKICSVCSSLLVVACGGGAESATDSLRDSLSTAAESAMELRVVEPWARTADSSAMTAVYLTLVNAGATADTLRGVTAADASEASIHVSMEHDGTMHMTAIPEVPMPSGDSVAFRPLATHLMLTGLTRALTEGDSTRLTLTFASGRSLEFWARVRQP